MPWCLDCFRALESHRRLASWRRRIGHLTGGALLGYKSTRDGRTLNLLEPPGEAPPGRR